MRRPWLAALAVPFVLVLAPTARGGAKPADMPTVVVRVKSLDALLQNLNLVVNLIGQAEEARKIEGLIKSKIGAKGLQGMDPTRPFGIYVRYGKAIDDVQGAILIPIADEKTFLALLKNAGVEYARDKDGIYTHKLDKNVDLYFRFAHKHLYLTSVNPASIHDKNLPDPAKALALPGNATIAIAVRVDQVPKDAKLVALANLDNAIAEAQKQAPPNETPIEKAFRIALLRDVGKLGSSLIRDAGEVRLELDVNDKAKDMTVNLNIAARPGSDLAKTIKGLGELKSPLAGLGAKPSAFHGAVQFALPDGLNQAFVELVREVRDNALKGIQDETKKAQGKSLFDAMMPTARAGEFHLAVAALGPKQERYTFLGALKLKDGDKLGKIVHDLLKLALNDIPADQRGKVKLDFDSVGAVKIHRFQLPKDARLDKLLNDFVGDNQLYLAFRDDALFLALGQAPDKEAPAALKAALAQTGKVVSPPLVFEIDVARMAPLMAQTEKQKDLAATHFPAGADGRLRLTIDGGASLNAHLQMRLNVLEFLMKMKKNAD